MLWSTLTVLYAVKSVKIHQINAVTKLVHHSSIEWVEHTVWLCVCLFLFRVNWSDCWLIYLFIWFAWLNIYTNVKINSIWKSVDFHLCVYHQTPMIWFDLFDDLDSFGMLCGRISSFNLHRTQRRIQPIQVKFLHIKTCLPKEIPSKSIFFFLTRLSAIKKRTVSTETSVRICICEQKSQILNIYHIQSNLYLEMKNVKEKKSSFLWTYEICDHKLKQKN